MAEPYSGVAISGYNANPPDDDGSQTEDNKLKWSTIKTKIADPTKTRTDSMDTALIAAFAKVIGGGGVTSYSTSSTVAESDQGKLVRVTASGVTITTPDATDVDAPFVFGLVNTSSGDITFDGNGSQTVDGDASITVPAGCGLICFTDGSNWITAGQNFPTPIVPPPAGTFRNLVIKVTGNTGLTVAADAIVVSDGTTYLTLTGVSHTINMATTGANALDTGSIAQNTWYALHEIAKADGTKAALASLSATSPTLPTDYIYWKRIGWVRTKSNAAQLLGTWQFGNRVQYKLGLAQTGTSYPSMLSLSNVTPTLTAIAISDYVPTTACAIQGFLSMTANSGVQLVYAAAPGNAGSIGTGTPVYGQLTNGGSSFTFNAPFDFGIESSNIYYTMGNATSGFALCTGWHDNL